MDKSCQQSSADSTSSSSSSRDHYLRHLNKLSQKISKPIIRKPTTFDNLPPPPPPPQNPSPPPPPPPPTQPQPPQTQAQPPQQHQPPVYNINKNDFRDVVQKLTGSPAHDRISTPPPIQQPKPQSSRLQRIRPPPLPQITNRPPQMMNAAPQPPQNPGFNFNFNFNAGSFNNNNAFTGFGRPSAPLSPLPPFPTVHAPAESPISAYMRDLQFLLPTMDSKSFSGFSPLPPPASSQPQPEQQAAPAVSQSQSQSPFQMPSSPFGCLNSPMSSYPLLSPGRLPFSPNSGQLGFPQLPLSPTVPVPSPRWRGL